MTTSAERAGAREEFQRGWKPLVAAGVGIGLGYSPIPPYASGLLASALETANGWSRADILSTLMVMPVALLVMGRVVGRLADRLGARRVALVSTAGLGVCQLALAAGASSLLAFKLIWIVLAVVAIGTLPTTYVRVVNSWFDRARGLALGLALATTGVTGAIMPYLLTGLIEAFGWRGGYLALAALPLCIGLPILLLWLHERPASEGASDAARREGMSVRDAVRSRRFWALAIGSLALAFATSGLMPNLLPILVEQGVDRTTALSALAALAVSVTGGRLLSGWLLDRLWAPLVGALLIAPAIVALLLLARPETGVWINVVAVVTLGLVAGAEFDLVAFMTGRYFGQRHFSELYSIQYAVFGIGAGFAPAIFGALRTRLDSYTPLVLLAALLLASAALLLLTLGRFPPAVEPIAAPPTGEDAAPVAA
jgi:MFS family permease